MASIEMRPRNGLRDTLWAPALVQTAPSFQGKDLGEVLIPAIYPFSWKHADEAVWLGRVTDWAADERAENIHRDRRFCWSTARRFLSSKSGHRSSPNRRVAPSEP